MDLLQLSRINFKQLSVLHVMLSTHSVNQSAEVLCMSPSSVSKALSQLRTLLADELFYREGTQLIPTPYALKVGPTVHLILNNMNGLLNQSAFEPQQFSGKFELSMRESTFEIFAPSISEMLSTEAPNSRINIHAKQQLGFEALLSGQVDLILLPHDRSQPPTKEKQLVWEIIGEDEMVCLMSSEHPLANQELTVPDYLTCKHIGIFDNELNTPYFEQNLTQRYKSREVVISVADFGSAAILCHQTAFLFTCSKRWAETAKQAKGLVIKPIPFDYGQVAYSMVYNRLSLNEQSLNWLFKTIRNSGGKTLNNKAALFNE